MATALPRLIALSPGNLSHGREVQPLLARMAQLHAGGLQACLLREPGLADAALLEAAHGLRAVFSRDAGGWLGVHDKLHVALAASADAVHLGFRSLAPLAAKSALQQVGGEVSRVMQVGLSTHAADDEKQWAGADYLFHGPVFETPSKVGLVEPIGLAGLRAALARVPRSNLPVYALGGIGAGNVQATLETGVHGAAVLGALNSGADMLENLAGLLAGI